MKEWEIWFAEFPFEEDSTIVKKRPVIIISVDPLEVLSVKVTSHDVRDYDNYDTPIVYWKEAGLSKESIARVSKTLFLTPDRFLVKFGILHNDDQIAIHTKYIQYLNSIEMALT